MNSQSSTAVPGTEARQFIMAESSAAGRMDSYNAVMVNIRRDRANANLWYGVWESNKDYSSLMNASFALGRLGSLVDLALFHFAEFNQGHLDLLEEIGNENKQRMETIAKNCGRIVPFYTGGVTSL